MHLILLLQVMFIWLSLHICYRIFMLFSTHIMYFFLVPIINHLIRYAFFSPLYFSFMSLSFSWNIMNNFILNYYYSSFTLIFEWGEKCSNSTNRYRSLKYLKVHRKNYNPQHAVLLDVFVTRPTFKIFLVITSCPTYACYYYLYMNFSRK